MVFIKGFVCELLLRTVEETDPVGLLSHTAGGQEGDGAKSLHLVHLLGARRSFKKLIIISQVPVFNLISAP